MQCFRRVTFGCACFILVFVFGAPKPARAQAKTQAAAPESRFPIAATTQNIALSTSTGTLYGTFEIPSATAPVPVVLLLAGDIPIDRNGNSHLFADSINTIKYLAEALAKQGVASLRFDKRGVAQSSRALSSELDLTMELYADDATAWGKRLHEDKRFSSLIVLGYGESSLVGILAARKLGADALVSVAGLGRPQQEVMLEQAQYFPPYMQKSVKSLVAKFEQGKTTDSIPPDMYILFRPSVQPYRISSFRYNPAKELGKLSMPCLVLHGTKDFIIRPQEANFLGQGNPSARVVLIENMTHNLRDAAQEFGKTPAQPKPRFAAAASPLVPRLIAEITEFTRAATVKKKKSQ